MALQRTSGDMTYEGFARNEKDELVMEFGGSDDRNPNISRSITMTPAQMQEALDVSARLLRETSNGSVAITGNGTVNGGSTSTDANQDLYRLSRQQLLQATEAYNARVPGNPLIISEFRPLEPVQPTPAPAPAPV